MEVISTPKNMKKIIFIIATIFIPFFLLAQSEELTKEKEDCIVNDWFIGLSAGSQILFSSDAENLNFNQRLTPIISLSGGKWFSPYWGARLQISGYSMNGFSTLEGRYIADLLPDGSYGNNDPVRNEVLVRPDGSYRHYLRYINAHADLQFSAMNLLFGYNQLRKWDIIPTLGLGYFKTFEYKGSPVTNNFSGYFALAGKYNVYKDFDVELELGTTLFPDKFDGRLTNRSVENNLSLALSVVYNFKKEKTYQPLKNLYDIKIKTKEERRENRKNQERDIVEKVAVVTEIVRDTIRIDNPEKYDVNKDNLPFALASIRFDLGQTKPIREQDLLFINVVKFLQENPSAKICLDGYGDKATGTSDINKAISTKRAKNIHDIFVEKYSINPQRISFQGIGDEEQPYEKNQWNRVVVVKVIDL